MKLPKKETVYPPDTNLLSWLFMVARNEDLLRRMLYIIQFIREHPNLSEAAARKELGMIQLRDMPPKRPEKLPKR